MKIKLWLKNYPVRNNLGYPVESLYNFTTHFFSENSRLTALVDSGREITYGELKASIDRLAISLENHGIRKGDRVALALSNSPGYVFAYYRA